MSNRQVVMLTNPAGDQFVAKILEVIGNECSFEDTQEGYPDDRYDFELPHSNDFLLAQGDDSWGAVVGAWMSDDKLILVVNFGDGGDYLFCPTVTQGFYATADDYVNPIGEHNIVRAVSL